MQSGFHSANLDTQNCGYFFERQFLILKQNQGFALLQRERGNGLPDHLRLLLLEKHLGHLRRFVDLGVFKVNIPIAQPVVSPGMISDSTIEIRSQGAFGWIETPRGIEETQKALLCDVFRRGGGVGQAVCHSKNHLSMPLKQQHECGLASAR